MDTLTHSIIGAVTGDFIAGRRFGKKAALWGMVIANLPDIDVIFQPFLPPAQSLLFHRGPTHSILFCALITPIIAKLLTIIHKNTKKNFKLWMKLSAWCLFTHLFTDCFNSYGTGIFIPFSENRIAIYSLSIIDLFFMAPLIFALIMFIFVKQGTKARKIIAATALSLSFLYIGYTLTNKNIIDNKVINQLECRNIKYQRILTTPLPLTNFIWLIVVESQNSFYLSNYNVKTGKIAYKCHFDKNYYLAKNFESDKEFNLLEKFSKYWYCLVKGENNEIIFHDLRFASFDFNGEGKLENTVLIHKIIQHYDGIEIIHSYPKRNFNKENIKKYIKQLI